MKGLELDNISLDWEEHRAGTEAPADAVASITLFSENEAWGEFLTIDDLLFIRHWIDRLIDARNDRRICYSGKLLSDSGGNV